ncbi:MAG: hypothetical protein IJA97_03080 [Clostridia bacterium]|nr:hypothetical protein [Clostridia bacterium]
MGIHGEDKDEFLQEFANLHVGEWRKSYLPDRFGVCVLDGVEWELKIEYNTHKSVKFSGTNAYPYNFKELLRVINAE